MGAKGRHNDRLGSVNYRSVPLSAPLLKTACLAEAEEAQRQIDERHARKNNPAPSRRNSRYSDEVVAQAREMSQTMSVNQVARRLNICASTIKAWVNGTNRGFSAASAKRSK
jgi:DNA-binding transcriptional regulator YiaG